MNETRARELFCDSLKEKLAPADAAALAAFLASNPGLRAEFGSVRDMFTQLEQMPAEQPGPEAKQALLAAIAAEQTADRTSTASSPRELVPSRRRFVLSGSIAAALLVGFGFFVGMQVGRSSSAASAPVAPQPQVAAAFDTGADDQASGTVRLERILAAADPARTGASALPPLLNALNDPIANNRISALQALYRYASRPEVRAAVSGRLARDPSALVQIAMIDFLSAASGPEAAPELETLSQNESVDADVRDAATYALAQL